MLSGRQKLLGALLVGVTVVLVGYSISHAFTGVAPTNEVSVPVDGSAEAEPAAEAPVVTGTADSATAPVAADSTPVDTGAAPLAISEAQEKPKNRLYTVQANDSFWSIAKKVYGDGKYVNKLCAANASHKTLRSGMRIVCPPFEGTTFKLDLPGIDEGAETVDCLAAPATAAVVAPADGVGGVESPMVPIESISPPRVHTVLAGENLYDIAKKYYKNGSAWPKIAAANPTINAKAIKPGQTLQIP